MECEDVEKLPEGCISTVLSLTSPQDACRSSLVSSTFRSAADSDVVWERFLPLNYQNIVSSAVSSVIFSSKKDLFFHLRNHPVLIDGGTKSFWLDRSTGKISYMQCARKLFISGSNDPLHWCWKSLPESRFEEVAELTSISRLEIKGMIKTRTLSPKTTYVAHLIMKFTGCAYGLDSIPSELSLKHGNHVSHGTAYLRGSNGGQNKWFEQLYYSNRTQMLRARVIEGKERTVRERSDGWMEIELGEFANDGGDEGEVKMSLTEVKGEQLKGGIIIEGIEMRPKVWERQNPSVGISF